MCILSTAILNESTEDNVSIRTLQVDENNGEIVRNDDLRSKDNNNIHTPNNLSDISISSSRGTNNDNITYEIPEYPFEIVIDKGNPINTYNSRGSLLSLGTILTDESKYYNDNFSVLNNTKTFNITNLKLENYYSIKSYNGLERMKLDIWWL